MFCLRSEPFFFHDMIISYQIFSSTLISANSAVNQAISSLISWSDHLLLNENKLPGDKTGEQVVNEVDCAVNVST